MSETSSSLLKKYKEDIEQYPKLSSEEETELLRKIKEEKDVVAEQDLIKSNLRSVVAIVEKYSAEYPDLDVMSLIEEGNIGLIQAVQKFDRQKDHQFKEYMELWVIEALRRIKDTIHA